MKTRNRFFTIIILAFSMLVLAACNFPGQAEPTATLGINGTQAHETVIARVTEMTALTASPAGEQPTATLEVVATTQIPTETPVATAIQNATAIPSATATPLPCDRAAPGNPIDVTIPDDTKFNPEQEFTKTWRLINVGTCTWSTSYEVVYFSGEKLSEQDAFKLSQSIGPGGAIDISVKMRAPENPGTYQSNWKLRNASGQFFGVGGDGQGAFWVRIVVEAATPTPTASATQNLPTVTPSPTLGAPQPTSPPAVHTSGTVTLQPGNALDLDSILFNTGGDDLSYATDSSGTHPLAPAGGASMGFLTGQTPSPAACQTVGLSTASVLAENLAAGSVLCYRTNEGRLGALVVQGFNAGDGSLQVSATTWVP